MSDYWSRPEVIDVWSFVFNQMEVFLTGVVGWEVIVTWRIIEWPLLTRKMRFKWSLLPYLLGRYSVLCAMISFIVTSGSFAVINCRVGYQFFELIGLLGAACASTNLMIRPLMLLKHRLYVCTFLVAMGLGHWAICLYVGLTNTQAFRNPETNRCTLQHSNHKSMSTLYLYTMMYDLFILYLTMYGIAKKFSVAKAVGVRTTLWTVLQQQGIWYCVVACTISIPPVVFPFLNLNAIMNVFFTPPAVTISTIASGRMVMSLVQFGRHEAEENILGLRAAQEGFTDARQQLSTQIMIPPSIDSCYIDDDIRKVNFKT